MVFGLRNKIYLRFLLTLVSYFILIPCFLLNADPIDDSINNATTWLLSQQNSSDDSINGSFGPEDGRQINTYEAFKTLMHLGGSDSVEARIRAINWFNEQKLEDTDGLARRLEVLSVSTASIEPVIREITQRQNSDGGWGLSSKYTSSPFHTALVLNALTYNNLVAQGLLDQAVIDRALHYLVLLRENRVVRPRAPIGHLIKPTRTILAMFSPPLLFSTALLTISSSILMKRPI